MESTGKLIYAVKHAVYLDTEADRDLEEQQFICIVSNYHFVTKLVAFQIESFKVETQFYPFEN